ncbi:hypothetical protein PIB30_032965 [Stylosanthes scabra]|uniref:Uncharacterized protein n=1 Tax=Stylosanthes scabra TaxID=79078 RepID=A0ABU6Z9A2_9FABA|nr:hypothetical protein [Stylosanthes scabra]
MRKKPDKGKIRSKGGDHYKERQPKWGSHNDNDYSHEAGSRFNALNHNESDKEILMQDMATEIDSQQQEPMHTGPEATETQKPQKTPNYVNQIQKRILKPGAGKNSQAQKKGPPKYGPSSSIRNSKNKSKVAEIQVVSGDKPKDAATTQPSSSRNEDILLRDNMILQDMRRLHQEQIQAFEASKMAAKNLESLVVKNPFLTQNPLFIKKTDPESSSKTMDGDGASKKKPPDIKVGDSNSKSSGANQVRIDQVNDSTRPKAQV